MLLIYHGLGKFYHLTGVGVHLTGVGVTDREYQIEKTH